MIVNVTVTLQKVPGMPTCPRTSTLSVIMKYFETKQAIVYFAKHVCNLVNMSYLS